MDVTTLIEEIRKYTNQHGLEDALAQYGPALASWPGENAACWFRVSPGPGQEEKLQVPQVLRHCADNNLRPVKFYVVHAKSAFKGEHQADLDRAVKAARDGEFSTLVIWHSDRIERRHNQGESKTLLATLAEFADAGCQVVSQQEPLLGKADFGSQVVTFIAGLVNNEKVIHIKEGVKLAQDEIAANNATGGRRPWGYYTDGAKLNRMLHPTDDCKKYVPLIFQHCIDGWSCAKIAVWLDSESVKSPHYGKEIRYKRGTEKRRPTVEKWHEGSVRHILRNATYAGRRIRRPKKGDKVGTTYQTCPEAAVIDMDTFERAQRALSTREKRGPSQPTKNPVKPMLAKL
jgi:DNA invertase Pin-like site-specific DNA recombinase